MILRFRSASASVTDSGLTTDVTGGNGGLKGSGGLGATGGGGAVGGDGADGTPGSDAEDGFYLDLPIVP